ncbi:MAG: carboxymuconolactone decarboxylase family protein, partial [Bdellovibrionota bacterium]
MPAKPLTPSGGWLGTASPRIAPDKDGFFTRLVTSAVRRMGRAEPPNIFLTLHRNPSIFWPWLLFASRFMPRGTIAELDRERVILRTAWNCRCRYEWEQHVDLATKAGLTKEEIA